MRAEICRSSWTGRDSRCFIHLRREATVAKFPATLKPILSLSTPAPPGGGSWLSIHGKKKYSLETDSDARILAQCHFLKAKWQCFWKNGKEQYPFVMSFLQEAANKGLNTLVPMQNLMQKCVFPADLRSVWISSHHQSWISRGDDTGDPLLGMHVCSHPNPPSGTTSHLYSPGWLYLAALSPLVTLAAPFPIFRLTGRVESPLSGRATQRHSEGTVASYKAKAKDT